MRGEGQGRVQGRWAGLIGLLAALLWLGVCAQASAQPSIEPRVILQNGHAGRVTAAGWTADSQYVMTGSWDRELLLWDLKGRIVDQAALPGVVAGYMTVLLFQPRPGGATVQVNIEGFENPGRDPRTYEWTFGRGVVETTAFGRRRRLWDKDSNELFNHLATPEGLPSPDGLQTLTLFRGKGEDASPYVRIRPKDLSAPAVPLVGQSGHSNELLAYLARPLAKAPDGTSPQILAAGAAFERQAARNDDIFTARRLNFALSPDGWLGAWFDHTGPGAGALQIFDFQQSAFAGAPILDPDYDQITWISARKLAIRSTLTSAPMLVFDLGERRLTTAALALCNAAPVADTGTVIGSGVSYCRRPHCADDGAQACARGPDDGVWISTPGGGLRALDTAKLPPDGYYEGPSADGSPPPRRILTEISVSDDGRLAVVGFGRDEKLGLRPDQAPSTYSAAIWDLASGKRIAALQPDTPGAHTLAPIGPVLFATDDKVFLALGSGETETTVVNVFDAKTGRLLRNFAEPTEIMIPDAKGKLVKRMRNQTIDVSHFALTPDRKRVVLLDSGGDTRVFDIATGKRVGGMINLPADAVGLGADPVRKLYWTQASTGIVTIHSPETGAVLLSLFNLPDQRFFITDAKGRYDSNLPPDSRALRWQMADAPLQSLAPQTFMRFLYEPRLAPRLLGCIAAGRCVEAFKPAPPTVSLNRVLPETRITRVAAGPSPDLALVDVEVRENVDPGAANGKSRSGIYDLRLFRDGALVAERTAGGQGSIGVNDLDLWRQAALLQPGADGLVRASFTVRLPTGADRSAVRFSAYAFNEDRVKGETAEAVYTRPTTPPRQPRAYVLAIGSNAYDNPAWALNFAAADARLIADRLRSIPGYAVEPATLVSDASSRQATKAGIRGALAKLAQTATPDDVVIVSFSGHGWASGGGDFYLLPSDAVVDGEGAPRIETLISSTELTEWMSGIDAGEIAVIIDACHSAASVEAQGFKAGPFGDAGLGQLAFDKGIRILAGAQADAVAMEDVGLKQGLLTYVLAREGLGDADPRVVRDDRLLSPLGRDGQVALDDWLRFAAHRLPSFSQQMALARMSPSIGQRGLAFDPPAGTATSAHGQEPSLFDFTGQPSRVRLSARPGVSAQ
ncbi:hypothetical protein BH11PSE2_BH11PSE2_10480 [soil metagenome]